MAHEFEIIPYSQTFKEIWDEFVESSKNGTFLFKRDYMDYHTDRFKDNSFIFFRKGKPYCLLPANISGDTLYSHQGLTYGGLIMNEECTTEGILDIFDKLLNELKNIGVKRLVYKPIPHIYHYIPSEEDLYALFRNNAFLTVRNVSTSLDREHRIPLTRQRRRSFAKSILDGITVSETTDIKTAWKIINNNLQERYNVPPVHNEEELKKLYSLFPENIKLYGAFKNEEMVGTAIMYFTDRVSHAQYIHANKYGKECGAVDALVNHILENLNTQYFDFGNSNEDGGRYLNKSLIHLKEGFGARAICYDTYEINF